MSQSMSATTLCLRRNIAAASRSSASVSRTTFLACSNSFSTSSQMRQKSHPFNPANAQSLSVGYTISLSAAPEIENLLTGRINGIARKGEDRTGVQHRRTMHTVPLTFLPTIKSWAESAKSSQPMFEIDMSKGDSLRVTTKKPNPKITYARGAQLIVHAESPTLAALGDALYAKLLPEIPDVKLEDFKQHVWDKLDNSSKKAHKKKQALQSLKKTASRESRWALHALLMSEKPKTELLKDGDETADLKPMMTKEARLDIMKTVLQPKVMKEKITVTGLYIQTSDLGEKSLLEFPFEGTPAVQDKPVVEEAVVEEPVKEEKST